MGYEVVVAYLFALTFRHLLPPYGLFKTVIYLFPVLKQKLSAGETNVFCCENKSLLPRKLLFQGTEISWNTFKKK